MNPNDAGELTLEQQRDAALIQAERLMEAAWGDYVPRNEYLYDDPSFGLPTVGNSRSIHITSLDDRADGRFRPIYETEQDLASIRAAARNLTLATGLRTGALDSLANYTLGTGFTFEAQPESDTDSRAAILAKVVQKCIDRFCDENDFHGVIDREIHHRSREDGECLIAFDENEIRAGRLLVEFLEPDQLVQPRDSQQLDEWLGMEEPSCWLFGVHTPSRKTWKALGYHVVRDGVGADWDYYPAQRVEHIKRNVTRNAKRGVSDFFEVLNDLRQESRLAANMVQGASLQAAIAWILQGAAGQTQSQLSGVGDKLLQYTRPAGPGGQPKTQNVNHYPAGTVLRVGAGVEYHPGPMGAERNAGFELVGQYALRRIGVRWNMPEYMISGDASNANYSSSLVAEAPFVKAREADQQFYKRHFLSLLWKVVLVYVESGRFERYGIGSRQYDELMRLVRIECECPTVASRDPKVAVDSDKVLVDGGVMSEQTWAARNGLDYEKEQKLGAAKAPPPMPAFGSPFGGPPGGVGQNAGLNAGPQEQAGQGQQPSTSDANPRQAAVAAALESVETSDEARAILRALDESWDESKHPRDDQGQFAEIGIASSELESLKSSFDQNPSPDSYFKFRDAAMKRLTGIASSRGWYPITDRAASSDYVRFVAYDANESEVEDFTVRISNHDANHGGFQHELRIDKGGFEKDFRRIFKQANALPEDAIRYKL